MPIISDRLTIYHRDGTTETLPADQARYRTYLKPAEWSLTPPPPLNWEREIPRYRVTRDLQPAQKARFRSEPPFSETWQSDCWQYGDRKYAAGEIVETTNWPDASMQGLNYSGQQVLAFFKAEMKSRLPTSPWHQGAVRLNNGFSNLPGISDVKPPQIQPMNLRPVA
jgi:hypothetical protein